MRIGNRNYKIDYGHLVFLTVMAGYVAWYLTDAISVSRHVNNLLLVAPVAIFTLAMALLIVPQCVQRAGAEEEPEEPEQYDPLAPKLPTERRQVLRMLMLGGVLGVFVISLAFIGFDTAIFLFVIAAMMICGERRPLHLAAFALAVTLFMVYGFRALMPYPMETLFL